MTNKGVPSVAKAKSLAKLHSLRRCVILFETEEGRVGYSSYGKDRQFCESTREIMDTFFDELELDINYDSRRLETTPEGT